MKYAKYVLIPGLFLILTSCFYTTDIYNREKVRTLYENKNEKKRRKATLFVEEAKDILKAPGEEQLDKAIARYKKALSRCPDPVWYYQLGELLLQNINFPEAKQSFELAIFLGYEKSEQAHYGIAATNMLENNRDQALDSLKEAFEGGFKEYRELLDDTRFKELLESEAFYELLYHYAAYPRLVDIFNKNSIKAYKTKTNRADKLRAETELDEQKKQYKRTKNHRALLKAYENAIKISPQPDFYYDMGNTYFTTEDYDKAVQSYRMAVFLNYKRSDYALYNSACAYAREGNIEKGFHYLKQALDAQYPHVDFLYKDPDIAPLRKEARFKELLKEYTVTRYYIIWHESQIEYLFHKKWAPKNYYLVPWFLTHTNGINISYLLSQQEIREEAYSSYFKKNKTSGENIPAALVTLEYGGDKTVKAFSISLSTGRRGWAYEDFSGSNDKVTFQFDNEGFISSVDDLSRSVIITHHKDQNTFTVKDHWSSNNQAPTIMTVVETEYSVKYRPGNFRIDSYTFTRKEEQIDIRNEELFTRENTEETQTY